MLGPLGGRDSRAAMLGSEPAFLTKAKVWFHCCLHLGNQILRTLQRLPDKAWMAEQTDPASPDICSGCLILESAVKSFH